MYPDVSPQARLVSVPGDDDHRGGVHHDQPAQDQPHPVRGHHAPRHHQVSEVQMWVSVFESGASQRKISKEKQ